MIRIIISLALWITIAFLALRFLARIGKLTRPQDPKSVQNHKNDPVSKAKKADIIDIK